MKTKVPIDWVGPEETEMFEPIPISEHQLDFQPVGTNPRELPNSPNHIFYVPTAGRNVDRQRFYHIAGPNEIAHGHEYPSEFDCNWLRPAPLIREIRFSGTCG
eukprot:4783606-Alexandrium_andersonii.AAC.1